MMQMLGMGRSEMFFCVMSGAINFLGKRGRKSVFRDPVDLNEEDASLHVV